MQVNIQLESWIGYSFYQHYFILACLFYCFSSVVTVVMVLQLNFFKYKFFHIFHFKIIIIQMVVCCCHILISHKMQIFLSFFFSLYIPSKGAWSKYYLHLCINGSIIINTLIFNITKMVSVMIIIIFLYSLFISVMIFIILTNVTNMSNMQQLLDLFWKISILSVIS